MPTVKQGFPNTIVVCWILVGGGSLLQNDVLSSFKLVFVKLKKKRRRRIRRNRREVHLFCQESLLRCVLQSCQWCCNWLISSHAFSSLFKMVSSWEKIGDDEKAKSSKTRGERRKPLVYWFYIHPALWTRSVQYELHGSTHVSSSLGIFTYIFILFSETLHIFDKVMYCHRNSTNQQMVTYRNYFSLPCVLWCMDVPTKTFCSEIESPESGQECIQNVKVLIYYYS